MDDETRDPVAVGIRQIEDLIRGGHIGAAGVAFELTASGLAPHADAAQMSRLRQLARTLGADESFLEGHPQAEAEVAQASRFGMH
ncbi:hypothetical protein VQH23_13835 [Pararoseomonas sp. SCSIO 73927]|uniref:hypothetical protein n=1 Tax=Pararoseomonas sp. SCSIO 73927 TaxID=3114537 RepID=UPI0030D18D21